MEPIAYCPDQIAEAEARYRNVQLEQRQRDLVNFLGTWFGKRIGMGDLPCRGYWVLAVAEWQVQKKRSVRDLETGTAAQRMTAAAEIAEHFRMLVGRALQAPEQHTQLDAAVRDGMLEYGRLYAAKRG